MSVECQFLLRSAGRRERIEAAIGISQVLFIVDVGKERTQRVKITRRERIIFVIMALSTSSGHGHEDFREISHPIRHVDRSILFQLDPAFVRRLE